MAAFGFFAGLPLSLSGFTLRQWLTEGHVSLAAIGLTANIGLAYTLKFLWAPLLDHVSPPGFLARFGRRRGWLLMIQPLLAASCFALALSDAATFAALTIAAAALIACCSATQDIVIDAWRIETFPQTLQGAAMAAYVWGYRVAMLVSGSGVIAAADLRRLAWRAAGRRSARARRDPGHARGTGAAVALRARGRAAVRGRGLPMPCWTRCATS